MKKIYLGAISALLLASCTTIQKASKTAKDVKEIGETIYNFKPNKNQKIKPTQKHHMKIEKVFLYDNEKFYEVKTFYFYTGMIHNTEENTISPTDYIFVSEGNKPKKKYLGSTDSKEYFDFLEKINRPSKKGNVTIISRFFSLDSLVKEERYYTENN